MSSSSPPDPGLDDLAGPIALLGFGHFGRALADLILEAGLSARALDPGATIDAVDAAASHEELLDGSRIVVLSVPVDAVGDALADLRPHLGAGHLVMDVCSVKAGPVREMARTLGGEIPWIATHPLFGPASIARAQRPFRAVVCPNALHPGAADRARRFYEAIGCVVAEQDADEHDRTMARTHALAFFVAKAMIEIGAGDLDTPVPPSFDAMARTIEVVRGDAGHLFYPIQHDNPHAEAARRQLLHAMERIHDRLARAPADAPPARALQIAAPPAPPPELHETRRLIDDVDQQILRLLAQRAELAHRAIRTKSEHGRAIRDPAREGELLRDRRAWAQRASLDPASVAGIFEAILGLSRDEQERWMRDRGS